MDAVEASTPRYIPPESVYRYVRECERLVAGAVADLEGERRPVEYTVHRMPDAVSL